MFKTVVLGLDGSESSDRALDYAAGFTRDHGSNVRVVHVIEVDERAWRTDPPRRTRIPGEGRASR